MELRGAKAESERERDSLSEELRATRDALHRRDVMLHRNQCDQQVAPHLHLCTPPSWMPQ